MNLKEELKAYVDGQLSPDQRGEIERAAATSPEIRQEIEALQALKAEFQPLTATPEPSGKNATLAALKSQRVVPRPTPIWGRLVAGIATALIVIAIAPEFGKQMSGSSAEEAAKAPAEWSESTVSGTTSPSEEYLNEDAASPAYEKTSDSAVPRRRVASSPMPETQAPVPRPTVPVVPSQYGRDIIYNGNLSVEVNDVQKSVLEATSLIQGLGGFIVSSQTSLNPNSEASAQLEIRVPAAKFDTANKALAKYGKVLSQNATGQDVTGDIARGEGRARALAVAEQEYIRMLNNTRNTTARLEIRRRLDEVRAEREGIKSETSRLKDLAAMSNLSVSFTQSELVRPDETSDNWWNDSNTGAANVLGAIGRIAGRVGIYLVYLSPVWLAGLAGWFIWRKKQR